MREEFNVKTKSGYTLVSMDLVNQISQELIAQTETEEELSSLVMSFINEKEARKEAWKMAYSEFPIPAGYVSLETRREIQAKRDELAEKYYQEIINR